MRCEGLGVMGMSFQFLFKSFHLGKDPSFYWGSSKFLEHSCCTADGLSVEETKMESCYHRNYLITKD